MLTTQLKGATASEYATISVPVCTFVGDSDHLTPPDRASAIKEALDARFAALSANQAAHNHGEPEQNSSGLPAEPLADGNANTDRTSSRAMGGAKGKWRSDELAAASGSSAVVAEGTEGGPVCELHILKDCGHQVCVGGGVGV